MRYVQNKGYVDVSGKKVCSKRQMQLNLARVAGYEGDNAAFTRLVIESRVNRADMEASFRLGAQMKAQQNPSPSHQ